jgi:sec-independent protein translocase protein TatC
MVFGIAFEVPVAVVVLVRIGIVTVEQLKAFRGYFIVASFIVAAVVTPPDVVSQLALAIPMCILYQIGIWVSHLGVKNRAKRQAEAATEGSAPSGPSS